MARRLTAASSQSFSSLTTPISSGFTLTAAMWFKPASFTANSVMFCLGDSGSSSNIAEIYQTGSTFNAFVDGTSANASNGVTSTTTWYHGCLRMGNGGAVVDVALGGVFGSANGIPGQSFNAIYLGAQRFSGSLSGFCDGALAEVGLWNIALSNAEVASLALGFSPLMIHPQNLVAYWPLFARATDEEDWVGTYKMVNSNGSTAVDHPRIIYPGSGFTYAVSGAGGPIAFAGYDPLVFGAGM